MVITLNHSDPSANTSTVSTWSTQIVTTINSPATSKWTSQILTTTSSSTNGLSTTTISSNPDDDPMEVKYNFFIGVLLAVASCLFIGTSFIVKKKALLRIERHNTARAGLGGYGYLKEWMWWLGLILMALGEVSNFVAYVFAPATLVTPLGALSVLVSAVLSSYILKESLNLLGKIGCFMCILGSVSIVLHSPHTENVYDMGLLKKMLEQPGFIVYVVLVVITALVLMFYFGPRYGSKNMLIYIVICSVIGSLSVMACKGIGIAIIQTANGINEFTNWLTWFCILTLILTVSVQMNYLNKALDIYNTSIVSAIYYVFFTTAVLAASAILFREWENMSGTNLIGVFIGFAIIVCAIFLLNVFKDLDITVMAMHEFLKNEAPSTSESSSEATVLFPSRNERAENGDIERTLSYESVSVDVNIKNSQN